MSEPIEVAQECLAVAKDAIARTDRSIEQTEKAIALAKELRAMLDEMEKKVSLFATAFVHACDDEGTNFGLTELYEYAKSYVTPPARGAIDAMKKDERGY